MIKIETRRNEVTEIILVLFFILVPFILDSLYIIVNLRKELVNNDLAVRDVD